MWYKILFIDKRIQIKLSKCPTESEINVQLLIIHQLDLMEKSLELVPSTTLVHFSLPTLYST